MLFEKDKKKVTLNENYFITFETKLAELQNEYGRIAYAHPDAHEHIIHTKDSKPNTLDDSNPSVTVNDIIKVLEDNNISKNKQAEFLEIIIAALYERQNPNDICGNLEKKIQILKQTEHETTTTATPNEPINNSNIILNNARGFKVNFFRVIYCLYELSFFKVKKGIKISKKEVFETFGKALNQDFSSFNNNLSSSKASANSDMKSTLEIFETMLAKQLEIIDR